MGGRWRWLVEGRWTVGQVFHRRGGRISRGLLRATASLARGGCYRISTPEAWRVRKRMDKNREVWDEGVFSASYTFYTEKRQWLQKSVAFLALGAMNNG